MNPQTKQDLPTAKEWEDAGFDVPSELCGDSPNMDTALRDYRDMREALKRLKPPSPPPVEGHVSDAELFSLSKRLARENKALREALMACKAAVENKALIESVRFSLVRHYSMSVLDGIKNGKL